MRRRRRDLELKADLNLTSLLDVMMVLLVCFMIVAPNLNSGIKLELPQVAEGTQSLSTENPLMVSIEKQNDVQAEPKIFLSGDEKPTERVTMEELKTRLEKKYTANKKVNVIVQCDRNEKSGILLQVLGTIQSTGIENIGLETESLSTSENKPKDEGKE